MSNLNNNQKLFHIKLIHTIIWFFFVSLISYVVYGGIANKINNFTWLAIALIAVEGLIILLNKGKCPLTPMAARYTDNRKDNFDVFLPNWLAKYNKLIFTIIFFIGFILIIYRVVG